MFISNYAQFIFSILISKVLAIVGALTLALCLGFFLYQWKISRAYRRFPSKILNPLQILMGRNPKQVTITKVIFQMFLNAVNEFREEGLCVLWILKTYVFVFNEKIVKHLVNEVDLADKGTAFEVNTLLTGNGLLASKHEVWKVHRKLLNPAFSVGVRKTKMHVLNKNAIQLVGKLQALVEETASDPVDAFQYYAFQNMADFVLDLDLNNGQYASLMKMFMEIIESGENRILDRYIYPWLHWDFLLPLFPLGRKYLKAVDAKNRLVQKAIDLMMESRAVSEREQQYDDPVVARSCGDILMKLYLRDHTFTDQDIRDQIVNLACAGYETVSITMLWIFYTLGHHPQVQEKAYSEVQTVVPEGDITYQDLAELKYLECVIKETLRLYSSVPLFERRATKDIQCDQYIIPKGARVVFFTFVLHRDPNVFPEPTEFIPERFQDSSKLRPWMYIPFSEGYRSCIGKKFAMMEMKMALAHVLRRFRITSLDKIDDSYLDWKLTLKPTKSLRFSFANRVSKT